MNTCCCIDEPDWIINIIPQFGNVTKIFRELEKAVEVRMYCEQHAITVKRYANLLGYCFVLGRPSLVLSLS
ncbi:hypothetical protein BpHYR1_010855 [Brachionus plicatilis]|uniref:Uncharacterized protein n=1 Tax=Brachionus plicatilis TaxID=10195 RepID=A0A3M7R5G9_BRAPC|nr:hypothetical protein BpHYR1_010855 [Brachionus plicatilis]